jgi:hypothetical protein
VSITPGSLGSRRSSFPPILLCAGRKDPYGNKSVFENHSSLPSAPVCNCFVGPRRRFYDRLRCFVRGGRLCSPLCSLSRRRAYRKRGCGESNGIARRPREGEQFLHSGSGLQLLWLQRTIQYRQLRHRRHRGYADLLSSIGWAISSASLLFKPGTSD